MGKNFDIASSVSKQLPFFSCMNIVLNKQDQYDISKYLYCEKFNVPPFEGSYEKQSFRWIQKCNIIQSCISKREADEYNKAKKDNIGT